MHCEDNVKISKHASKRLKERQGFKKRSNTRMIEKVLNEGYDLDETKGVLNNYLRNKKDNYKELGEFIYRVYGEYVYIFNENEVLVTSILLPPYIKKNLKKLVFKKV